MRLLLVDDERLILEELITITDWKRIGISHIETAGNVEQAKGIIRNYRPDIILCDIEMPQSSGLELLAWCKDNGRQGDNTCWKGSRIPLASRGASPQTLPARWGTWHCCLNKSYGITNPKCFQHIFVQISGVFIAGFQNDGSAIYVRFHIFGKVFLIA